MVTRTLEQRVRISAGVAATFPPVADRFWAKVDRTEECWLWTAYVDRDGYGRFHRPETRQWGLAHRWAYEQEHGPIPEGLEIDHLCRTRSCVRPSHMELTSHLVNMQRGVTANKTRCPQGHPYSEANTYRTKTGRFCRECGRQRGREYRARKKEETL